MNTLRNTVSLIGNLGADPAITQFGDNNSLARFSVATHESYKDKKGEWVNNTTWHNVVAWGKNAELCNKLLKKGTEIALEGKLVNDSFETKEGEKRYKTEISMREFMVLDRDKKQEK
ncbi:single-stranded DNA-binding protein [Brumimicrobium aurantiacum]|uniref:Single-stranded DNA-binding protein n=1 Tax=Brumimicrobium aurantiacum TaxID=1737063 RepID=A0A3E1F200_9FLAO|nr:single-stranded DNA-binding protein [Brumimicrobium aurantiacum]RFC55852.1 single-stranded DNA-binding protein [Brumimicrobium aurantiacum]